MRSRSLLLGLVLCALAGCGPSAKQLALHQADSALRRGDLPLAAEHLRHACGLDPRDTELCARAERTERDAIERALRDAQAQQRADKLEAALNTLLRVREMDRAGKLHPALDELGAAFAARCEVPPLSEPPHAITLVRCLEQHRAALERPSFDARVRGGRERAGAHVAQAAAQSAEHAHHGSAFVRYGLALCLSGDHRYDEGRDQAYAQLYPRVAIPTSLQTQLPWSAPSIDPQRHCEELHAERPVLECSADLRADLRAEVTVVADNVQHSQRAIPRAIDYVDRIEEHDNPEWRELEQRRRRLEQKLPSKQHERERAYERCERAEADWRNANLCRRCPQERTRETACERARNVERDLGRHRDELGAIERQLSQTPRVLRREIVDTFRYDELEHSYVMPYRFTTQLRSGDQLQSLRHQGQIELRATEHVGFAKAGLREKPLQAPSQLAFSEPITQRAHLYGKEVILTELRARATKKLASCGDPRRDESALDCWVEGQALLAVDPTVAYSELLGEAVDPRYPKASCQ